MINMVCTVLKVVKKAKITLFLCLTNNFIPLKGINVVESVSLLVALFSVTSKIVQRSALLGN